MKQILDRRTANRIEWKKGLHFLVLITVSVLMALLLSCASQQGQKPVIGVAWRSNQNTETFTAICEAIETAGGVPVALDQILSADLTYENGMLTEGKDTDGCLTEEAVKRIRCNSWQNSNTGTVMEGITAVVFPGGEEISPSLYYDPKPALSTERFSAERDVSDFLLMTYCLENDIAILAICRGMEMLSIVSGAEMIQDIPDYLESLGLPSNSEHRIEPESPGDYPGLSFHDVTVTDRDCLLYRVAGKETIENVPSWHHQAVKNVEGTRLKVTGITETAGIDMIEAVERPDKSFVLGLQFHPEIAVARELDDTSLCYFKAVVAAAGK